MVIGVFGVEFAAALDEHALSRAEPPLSDPPAMSLGRLGDGPDRDLQWAGDNLLGLGRRSPSPPEGFESDSAPAHAHIVDVKLRGKKAPSSRRSRESSTSGRRANSRRGLTAVKTASYRGVQSRRRLLQIRECIVRKAQAISPVGDVVARFDLARIEDFGKSLGRGTDLIWEISSSIRALNSASGCMASMLSAIINCQARLRRSAWYGPAIWTPKPLPVSTPESTCIITAIAYTARISRVQSILSSHVPQQI